MLSVVVQAHLDVERLGRIWTIGGPAVAVLAVLAVLAVATWLAHRRRTVEWAALVVGRIRFWRHLPAAQLRAQGTAWWHEMEAVLGPARRRRVVALLALPEPALDAVCFGASLAAVGVGLRPGTILVCYGVIVVATMVPFLPAGLGAVETVVPALLHQLGVPLASGLPEVVHPLAASLSSAGTPPPCSSSEGSGWRGATPEAGRGPTARSVSSRRPLGR